MDNDFDIINVRKLEKLLKCEKAYEISEKNISGVYSKRYEFLMKLLKCLCGCLHEGEMASYEKIMDRLAHMFDREYLEEWFHCRAEYNALKDKDFRQFRRLAHFLEESGYVICQKDLCLTTTLPTRIRGYGFQSYSVRIDAVAERNSCKEAVIFSVEKPEYNDRARKKENRPSSCLELMAAACACIENNNGFDGTDVSLYRIFAVLGKESLLPKKRASETLYQKMCRDGSIEPINFDSIMDCTPYQCVGTYTGQMEIMKRIFDALYFLKYSYYADMGVLIKALTGTLLGEDGGYALGSLSKKIRNARINTVQELYGLMSKMAEYRDDTKSDWEPCADKVNLLTVHESKGLEFPVVIILNSEEFQKDEEERKLFFVGMTRARRELLIAESEYKRFEMFDEIASSCRLVDAAYEIK